MIDKYRLLAGLESGARHRSAQRRHSQPSGPLSHHYARLIDDQRKRNARYPDSLLQIGFEFVSDFAERHTNTPRRSENVLAATTLC